ncbi:hypothetical protein [Streptosporangium roseum]|uniref:Uncharacterized protein n=1 Tax=Streptosporangium roseum (strain ATCC 12428 / DSM 43021 / JCM 3005 / KCTC 9067 / NCIMB 10171 / NRRL 2505 / NI 9100) TaxID=479432 RepID=D2B9N0_STRRD|nr:hypothetical protein [Streptosporangium roseum]ACZ84036.1 hypothetical protein Sros_1036 [Streptosporangium roseum DSM 43021]
MLLDEFVTSVRGGGTLALRDPRTTPVWHNLSGLPGFPNGVTDVATSVIFEGVLPYLHVAVQSASGDIARTRCLVGLPVPVMGGYFAPGTPLGPPAYPANCTAFVNNTPTF